MSQEKHLPRLLENIVVVGVEGALHAVEPSDALDWGLGKSWPVVLGECERHLRLHVSSDGLVHRCTPIEPGSRALDVPVVVFVQRYHKRYGSRPAVSGDYSGRAG